MPDILLVQPPVQDFYLTAKRTFPYGLACMAASLRQAGFSVEILDALAVSRSRIIPWPAEMEYLRTFYEPADASAFRLFNCFRHYGYSFEHIGKIARESGAFLVGISSLFTAYSLQALETARIVKAFHPACKVVLGGHHPTALPREALNDPAVDFIIRGEGEISLPLLAQALQSGKAADRIPGIGYRASDGSFRISQPTFVADLETIPAPALDLVNRKFYRRKDFAAVVVASRGCPMHCSYCSMGANSPLPYRKRSADSVLKEIENAVQRFGARFIEFEDENLSLDRKEFLSLLKSVQTRFGHLNPELRAMNGLFPPSLDEETVCAMKQAGFRALNLSLGTRDPDQLKRFNRADVRNSFENALNLAEKYGLEAVGYIIVGAPGQQAETSISDLLYLAGKRVLAGVSVFYPAPGSADFEYLSRSNALPASFSLMRSSALPANDPTRRTEAITLLRLGRILNFIKKLIDAGEMIPEPSKQSSNVSEKFSDPDKTLLSWFLNDGHIRGMAPDGKLFTHAVCHRLTRMFINGLMSHEIRGCRSADFRSIGGKFRPDFKNSRIFSH